MSDPHPTADKYRIWFAEYALTIREALRDLIDAIPETTLDADPPLRVWVEQAESTLRASASPSTKASVSMDRRSTEGLFGKFVVNRVDGTDAVGEKHHGCTYFVLDLQHDKHMPPALRAYADSCESDYPVLARQLRIVADDFGSRSEFAGIMAQKPALDLERQRASASERPEPPAQTESATLQAKKIVNGMAGLFDDYAVHDPDSLNDVIADVAQALVTAYQRGKLDAAAPRADGPQAPLEQIDESRSTDGDVPGISSAGRDYVPPTGNDAEPRLAMVPERHLKQGAGSEPADSHTLSDAVRALAAELQRGKATAYEQLKKLESHNRAHDWERGRHIGRLQAFSEIADQLDALPSQDRPQENK